MLQSTFLVRLQLRIISLFLIFSITLVLKRKENRKKMSVFTKPQDIKSCEYKIVKENIHI